MKKRGMGIWDLLAWAALAGILIWLILKTLGIISTPVILEYAPIYAAVYIAGWQIHKLYIVAEEVKELRRFKEATVSEINCIKTNCAKNHSK